MDFECHSLLVRDDGEAVAFGANDHGQCDVPLRPEGTRYVDAAAGGFHSLLVRDDGEAVACGGNDHGQCDVPLRPVGISCMTLRTISSPWTPDIHPFWPAPDREVARIVLLVGRRPNTCVPSYLLRSRVLPFVMPMVRVPKSALGPSSSVETLPSDHAVAVVVISDPGDEEGICGVLTRDLGHDL